MLERLFEKKDATQYNNSEEDLDVAIALDDDIALNLSSIESDEDAASREDAEAETVNGEDAAAEGQIADDSEPKTPEEICKETAALAIAGQLGVDQAIVTLESLAMGDFPEAWIYLGELCSELAAAYDPIEAFKCFETAANLEIAEGYYRLGLCYYDGFGCDKDERRAVDCFLNGAEKDHVGCIRVLGICRELGVGCPIDYEMAVALYTKAATLGDAVAINNLGGCYFYGHGVPQNKEYAAELYERAAMLGNANASCRLGICYETGDGCNRDVNRAVECYRKAAEAGNAMAWYHLGICYYRGVGVEQSFARAFEAYSEASGAGCAQATYEVGAMYRHGKGTAKDHDMAYRMFLSAAEAGVPAAEYQIGNCYFEGAGTVRNREEAFAKYSYSYMLDDSNAKTAFKLGLCKLRGLGTDKNEEEAFKWFCRGDELGSRSAAYMRGECYFYGVGVEENKTLAVECYERSLAHAYEHKDRTVFALIALADCLEHGYGIERDSHRALVVYKQAADFGSEEAMYLTGRAILESVGMQADYSAARIYILRAARKGYVPAMMTMGMFADEGKGIPRSYKDAKQWYLKAINAEPDNRVKLYEFPERTLSGSKMIKDAGIEARYRLGMLMARNEQNAQSYISSVEHIALAASLGHEDAQTEMSKIYVHGGDLKSYFESPFSRKDALFEDGEATPDKTTLGAAMNKLGDALYDGKSMVKKNETAAARCYKIAAELGNTEACYNYGWCLRHGVGVYENDAEAIKWLKLAADRGNSNAAYSYGLCCEEGAGSGIKNKREALFYYRIAAAAGHAEAAKRYVMLTSKE